MDKINDEINDLSEKSRHLNDLNESLKIDKKKNEIEYNNTYNLRENLDGNAANQREKEKLIDLTGSEKKLTKKLAELKDLLNVICNYKNNHMLEFEVLDFMNSDISSIEKNKNIREFRKLIDTINSQLASENYKLKQMEKSLNDQLIANDKLIENCKRNLPDYSSVYEQNALKNEINAKFKEMKIDSEADFASSFVVDLKNEEWRKSIEAFLGRRRYSIVVEPEYFDIANEVMNCSKHRYVELVNTKLLQDKKVKIVEDSVVNQLQIKNDIARKCFEYWLGKMHAVKISDVPTYENAISIEGKISRGMSVSFLNFKKIGSYCLGEDAAKLNLNNAIRKRELLEKESKDIYEKLQSNDNQLYEIKNLNMVINKDYDFSVVDQYLANQKEIHECEKRIHELTEALEKNGEYVLLSERLSEISEKINKYDDSIYKNTEELSDIKSEVKRLEEHKELLRPQLKESKRKLEKTSQENKVEYTEALLEYEDYILDKNKGNAIWGESKEKLENNKLIELRINIKNNQEDYCHEYVDLGVGNDNEIESEYRRRLNKIKMTDVEELKSKVKEQTYHFERIFKNEFVLKIKTNIDNAIQEKMDINQQLRNLNFSTQYRFVFRIIDDSSDFAKILEYANYLEQRGDIDDGQMVLGSIIGIDDDEIDKRNEEISEIINRLISKDDDILLNKFADYRNYMTYDIKYDEGNGQAGLISDSIGYDSGAGKQIPYTIILTAALTMIYNARGYSTRLVFIDEPFESFDEENVKIMIDFFKSQNLQAIFCAPDGKLNSIGEECDVVLSVLKKSPSVMTIGRVEFDGE